MKILLVHNFYKIPGGEDQVFRNEEKLLKEHGHEVYEYTRDNADMKPWDLLMAPYSIKTERDIAKIIGQKGIELVHVHNTQFLISPSVFDAAGKRGIPVVQTLHNFRPLCIGAQLYRDGKVCRECMGAGLRAGVGHGCYRGSRLFSYLAYRVQALARKKRLYEHVHFICLTEFNRSIFIKGGMDPERLHVKPNFLFSLPEAVSLKASPEKSRGYFLYIGRLSEEKGIEDILRCWAGVPADKELLICGGGESSFVDAIKRKYGRPNIRFLGSKPHDKAMEILKGAAAMIFASRWYEGFPMTIIESFFLGTPVLGLGFGNGGNIIRGVYGRSEALMGDMSELPHRIAEFERDRDRGLYDFDPERLKDFTAERNYEILMGIYAGMKCG